MLSTILITWLLLTVLPAVFIGKCMAVGMGHAEGASVRPSDLETTTSEGEGQPVAA